MKPTTALITAALAALAPRAEAQTRPPATPLHDVDVTYEAPGGGAQRMRWQAASHRMRLDPPSQALYLIVDYTSHRMEVVRPAQRAIVELPSPAGMLPGASSAARYDRQGEDQVAGLACTLWNTADVSGAAVTACITEDGVLLRASAGTRVLVEARSVSYGAQDDATFMPPDGFSHVTGASAASNGAK